LQVAWSKTVRRLGAAQDAIGALSGFHGSRGNDGVSTEIDGGIARKDVEFALYLGRIPREEADFVKDLDSGDPQFLTVWSGRCFDSRYV